MRNLGVPKWREKVAKHRSEKGQATSKYYSQKRKKEKQQLNLQKLLQNNKLLTKKNIDKVSTLPVFSYSFSSSNQKKNKQASFKKDKNKDKNRGLFKPNSLDRFNTYKQQRNEGLFSAGTSQTEDKEKVIAYAKDGAKSGYKIVKNDSGQTYILDDIEYDDSKRCYVNKATGLRMNLNEAIEAEFEHYQKSSVVSPWLQSYLDVWADILNGKYSTGVDDSEFRKWSKKNYTKEDRYVVDEDGNGIIKSEEVLKIGANLPPLGIYLGDYESYLNDYCHYDKNEGTWFVDADAPELATELGPEAAKRVQDAWNVGTTWQQFLTKSDRELVKQMKMTAGWDPNASDSLFDTFVRDSAKYAIQEATNAKNTDNSLSNKRNAPKRDISSEIVDPAYAKAIKGVGKYFKTYLFNPLSEGDYSTAISNGFINFVECTDYAGVGGRALASSKVNIKYSGKHTYDTQADWVYSGGYGNFMYDKNTLDLVEKYKHMSLDEIYEMSESMYAVNMVKRYREVCSTQKQLMNLGAYDLLNNENLGGAYKSNNDRIRKAIEDAGLTDQYIQLKKDWANADKWDSPLKRLYKAYTTHENYNIDTGNIGKDTALYFATDPSVWATLGLAGFAKGSARAVAKAALTDVYKNAPITNLKHIRVLDKQLNKEVKSLGRDMFSSNPKLIEAHATRAARDLVEEGVISKGAYSTFVKKYETALGDSVNTRLYKFAKSMDSASDLINGLDNISLKAGLYLPFATIKTIKGTRSILRNNERIAKKLDEAATNAHNKARDVYYTSRGANGETSILDFSDFLEDYKNKLDSSGSAEFDIAAKLKYERGVSKQRMLLKNAIHDFINSEASVADRTSELNHKLALIFRSKEGYGPTNLNELRIMLQNESARAVGAYKDSHKMFDSMFEVIRDGEKALEEASDNEIGAWIERADNALTEDELFAVLYSYRMNNPDVKGDQIDSTFLTFLNDKYYELHSGNPHVDIPDPMDKIRAYDIMYRKVPQSATNDVPTPSFLGEVDTVIPKCIVDCSDDVKNIVHELSDYVDSRYLNLGDFKALKEYLSNFDGDKISPATLVSLLNKTINSLSFKVPKLDHYGLPTPAEIFAKDANIFIYSGGEANMKKLYDAGVYDIIVSRKSYHTVNDSELPHGKKINFGHTHSEQEYLDKKLTSAQKAENKKIRAKHKELVRALRDKGEVTHINPSAIASGEGVFNKFNYYKEYRKLINEYKANIKMADAAEQLILIRNKLLPVISVSQSEANKIYKIQVDRFKQYMLVTDNASFHKKLMEVMDSSHPFGKLLASRNDFAKLLDEFPEVSDTPHLHSILNDLNNIAFQFDAVRSYCDLTFDLKDIGLPDHIFYTILDTLFGISGKKASRYFSIKSNDMYKFLDSVVTSADSAYGASRIALDKTREIAMKHSPDKRFWGAKYSKEVQDIDRELLKSVFEGGHNDPLQDVKVQIMSILMRDKDAVSRYNKLAEEQDVLFLDFETHGLNPNIDPISQWGVIKWKPGVIDDSSSLEDILNAVDSGFERHSDSTVLHASDLRNVSERKLRVHYSDRPNDSYKSLLKRYIDERGTHSLSEVRSEGDVLDNLLHLFDDSYAAMNGVVPVIVTHSSNGFDIRMLKKRTSKLGLKCNTIDNMQELFSKYRDTFKETKLLEKYQVTLEAQDKRLISEAIVKFAKSLPEGSDMSVLDLTSLITSYQRISSIFTGKSYYNDLSDIFKEIETVEHQVYFEGCKRFKQDYDYNFTDNLIIDKSDDKRFYDRFIRPVNDQYKNPSEPTVDSYEKDYTRLRYPKPIKNLHYTMYDIPRKSSLDDLKLFLNLEKRNKRTPVTSDNVYFEYAKDCLEAVTGLEREQANLYVAKINRDGLIDSLPDANLTEEDISIYRDAKYNNVYDRLVSTDPNFSIEKYNETVTNKIMKHFQEIMDHNYSVYKKKKRTKENKLEFEGFMVRNNLHLEAALKKELIDVYQVKDSFNKKYSLDQRELLDDIIAYDNKITESEAKIDSLKGLIKNYEYYSNNLEKLRGDWEELAANAEDYLSLFDYNDMYLYSSSFSPVTKLIEDARLKYVEAVDYLRANKAEYENLTIKRDYTNTEIDTSNLERYYIHQGMQKAGTVEAVPMQRSFRLWLIDPAEVYKDRVVLSKAKEEHDVALAQYKQFNDLYSPYSSLDLYLINTDTLSAINRVKETRAKYEDLLHRTQNRYSTITRNINGTDETFYVRLVDTDKNYINSSEYSDFKGLTTYDDVAKFFNEKDFSALEDFSIRFDKGVKELEHDSNRFTKPYEFFINYKDNKDISRAQAYVYKRDIDKSASKALEFADFRWSYAPLYKAFDSILDKLSEIKKGFPGSTFEDGKPKHITNYLITDSFGYNDYSKGWVLGKDDINGIFDHVLLNERKKPIYSYSSYNESINALKTNGNEFAYDENGNIVTVLVKQGERFKQLPVATRVLYDILPVEVKDTLSNYEGLVELMQKLRTNVHQEDIIEFETITEQLKTAVGSLVDTHYGSPDSLSDLRNKFIHFEVLCKRCAILYDNIATRLDILPSAFYKGIETWNGKSFVTHGTDKYKPNYEMSKPISVPAYQIQTLSDTISDLFGNVSVLRGLKQSVKSEKATDLVNACIKFKNVFDANKYGFLPKSVKDVMDDFCNSVMYLHECKSCLTIGTLDAFYNNTMLFKKHLDDALADRNKFSYNQGFYENGKLTSDFSMFAFNAKMNEIHKEYGRIWSNITQARTVEAIEFVQDKPLVNDFIAPVRDWFVNDDGIKFGEELIELSKKATNANKAVDGTYITSDALCGWGRSKAGNYDFGFGDASNLQSIMQNSSSTMYMKDYMGKTAADANIIDVCFDISGTTKRTVEYDFFSNPTFKNLELEKEHIENNLRDLGHDFKVLREREEYHKYKSLMDYPIFREASDPIGSTPYSLRLLNRDDRLKYHENYKRILEDAIEKGFINPDYATLSKPLKTAVEDEVLTSENILVKIKELYKRLKEINDSIKVLPKNKAVYDVDVTHTIPVYEHESMVRFARDVVNKRNNIIKDDSIIKPFYGDWLIIIDYVKQWASKLDVGDSLHYLTYLKEPNDVSEAFITAQLLYNKYLKLSDLNDVENEVLKNQSLNSIDYQYRDLANSLYSIGRPANFNDLVSEGALKILHGEGLETVFRDVENSTYSSRFMVEAIEDRLSLELHSADYKRNAESYAAYQKRWGNNFTSGRDFAIQGLSDDSIELFDFLREVERGSDDGIDKVRGYLNHTDAERRNIFSNQILNHITKSEENLINHLLFHNQLLVVPFNGTKMHKQYVKKLLDILEKNPEHIVYYPDSKYIWVGLDRNCDIHIHGDSKYLEADTEMSIGVNGTKYSSKALDDAYQHIGFDVKCPDEFYVEGVTEKVNEKILSAYNRIGYLSDDTIKGSLGIPYTAARHQAIVDSAPSEFKAMFLPDSVTFNQRLNHSSQFDFTVLGDAENCYKITDYDSSDILQNIHHYYNEEAGMISTERLYVSNFFDANSHCRLKDVFEGYTDSEKLTALKNCPDQVVVTLVPNKHTRLGLSVKRIKITDSLSVRLAESANAILVPYDIYVEMVSIINSASFNKTYLKVWSKIMFFMKVAHLCNPGTWFRNWMDGTIKSCNESGSIGKTAVDQVKAMKMLIDYNTVVKKVRNERGIYRGSVDDIGLHWESYKPRHSNMTFEQFKFMEDWLRVSISGGESKMLKDIMNKRVNDIHKNANLKYGTTDTLKGRKALKEMSDRVAADIVRFEDLDTSEIESLLKEYLQNNSKKKPACFTDDFTVDDFIRVLNLRKVNPNIKLDDETFRMYCKVSDGLLWIRNKRLNRTVEGAKGDLDYFCSMMLSPMSKVEQVVRLGQFITMESEGFTKSQIFKSITDSQFEYELKSQRVKGLELFITYFNFEFNNLTYWVRQFEDNPQFLYTLEKLWNGLSWNAARDYYENEDIYNNKSIAYMMVNGAIPLTTDGLYLKTNPSAIGALNWFYATESQYMNAVVPPIELFSKWGLESMGGHYAEVLGNLDYSFADKETWQQILEATPVAGTIYTRYFQHFTERKPWERLDGTIIQDELVKYFPTIFGAVYRYNRRYDDDFDAFQKKLAKQGKWYDCNLGKVVDISRKNTEGLNDPNISFEEKEKYELIFHNQVWDANYMGFSKGKFRRGRFTILGDKYFDDNGKVSELGLNRKFDFTNNPDDWDEYCRLKAKYHNLYWDKNQRKFVSEDEYISGGLNSDNLTWEETCELNEKLFGTVWDSNQGRFVQPDQYIAGGLNAENIQWDDLVKLMFAIHGKVYNRSTHEFEKVARGIVQFDVSALKNSKTGELITTDDKTLMDTKRVFNNVVNNTEGVEGVNKYILNGEVANDAQTIHTLLNMDYSSVLASYGYTNSYGSYHRYSHNRFNNFPRAIYPNKIKFNNRALRYAESRAYNSFTKDFDNYYSFQFSFNGTYRFNYHKSYSGCNRAVSYFRQHRLSSYNPNAKWMYYSR